MCLNQFEIENLIEANPEAGLMLKSTAREVFEQLLPYVQLSGRKDPWTYSTDPEKTASFFRYYEPKTNPQFQLLLDGKRIVDLRVNNQLFEIAIKKTACFAHSFKLDEPFKGKVKVYMVNLDYVLTAGDDE